MLCVPADCGPKPLKLINCLKCRISSTVTNESNIHSLYSHHFKGNKALFIHDLPDNFICASVYRSSSPIFKTHARLEPGNIQWPRSHDQGQVWLLRLGCWVMCHWPRRSIWLSRITKLGIRLFWALSPQTGEIIYLPWSCPSLLLPFLQAWKGIL